ncbi:hypothetical protein [Herbidospora mongoliensis]|nr:hypothetical protein [Herbidospora mongoliensis]
MRLALVVEIDDSGLEFRELSGTLTPAEVAEVIDVVVEHNSWHSSNGT